MTLHPRPTGATLPEEAGVKILTIEPDHDPQQVRARLKTLGLWTQPMPGGAGEPTQLLVSADSVPVPDARLRELEGIAAVASAPSPHPLVDAHPGHLTVGGLVLGAERPVLMAGPCSVESEAQIHEAAAMVAARGARVLRGGCFKPRTSPYSFQGVGAEGLAWMRAAADAHELLVITEAMSPRQVDVVGEVADIFQVGARNMQNFDLLHAIGRAQRPALLKRGLGATITEWLQAAEHLLHAGAEGVILCERGVRGFDGTTRFLFDVAAVAQIRHVHGLPIIADPSHATGRKDLIGPVGAAALAAGADGLIVESHPHPERACSDGPQQLTPDELERVSGQWGFVQGA